MSTAPPFEFISRQPEPPLARFVESVWYARGTVPYAREKIAPTGSTVAVFVLSDPIKETPNNGEGTPLVADFGFLLGPHDRPVVNEPLGETFAVGIVGTPIGCEALFGIRPSLIRGAAVNMESSWPSANALRQDLLEAADPEGKLEVVEQHLATHHNDSIPGLDLCEQAARQLEADPVRPIADIADELGVSHGHLDREFARVVGLSPRALARLLRVQRLLAGLDVLGDSDWADLAMQLGWFDQAHLIRDFKRHTGVTPSRYVAAQRGTFTEEELDEAVGFVPE